MLNNYFLFFREDVCKRGLKYGDARTPSSDANLHTPNPGTNTYVKPMVNSLGKYQKFQKYRSNKFNLFVWF